MAAHLGRRAACSAICDWLLKELAHDSSSCDASDFIWHGMCKGRENVLRCFGMAMLFAFRSAKKDCCNVFTLHPLYRVYLASDVEEKKHYWQQVNFLPDLCIDCDFSFKVPIVRMPAVIDVTLL